MIRSFGMMSWNRTGRLRRGIAVGALVVLGAGIALGCQKRGSENASGTGAPAEALKVPAHGVPVNLHYVSSATCVEFNPDTSHVRDGDSLVFNSSSSDTIWIHIAPGAFRETLLVVTKTGKVSTGPAIGPPGTFYMIGSIPGNCRVVAAPGPGVIIDDDLGHP